MTYILTLTNILHNTTREIKFCEYFQILERQSVKMLNELSILLQIYNQI